MWYAVIMGVGRPFTPKAYLHVSQRRSSGDVTGWLAENPLRAAASLPSVDRGHRRGATDFTTLAGTELDGPGLLSGVSRTSWTTQASRIRNATTTQNPILVAFQKATQNALRSGFTAALVFL